MAGAPIRSITAASSASTMPPFQELQATEVAVSPRARRRWASASRWALAAA